MRSPFRADGETSPLPSHLLAWRLIRDRASISALTELPLSLLPTFLVPLIIFTHVLIFNRLRALRPSVAA